MKKLPFQYLISISAGAQHTNTTNIHRFQNEFSLRLSYCYTFTNNCRFFSFCVWFWLQNPFQCSFVVMLLYFFFTKIFSAFALLESVELLCDYSTPKSFFPIHQVSIYIRGYILRFRAVSNSEYYKFTLNDMRMRMEPEQKATEQRKKIELVRLYLLLMLFSFQFWIAVDAQLVCIYTVF